MHIMSAAGRRALIETFEGLRRTAYLDAVGVPTIGYGHTSRAGAPLVRLGMTISEADADAFLARDLGVVERAMAAVLRAPTQAACDAFFSLAFNVGCGAVRSSSALRLFNAGRLKDAANAFLAWDRAAGRVLPGLARRRAAERAWLLGAAPGETAALAAAENAHAVDHPQTAARRVINRVVLAATRRA